MAGSVVTETESHLEDVLSGLQLSVNGDVRPIPPPEPDPAALVVKGLRDQLVRADARGRRRGIRAQLAADVATKPGEILDAIWTRVTTDPRVVGLLLAVAGGATVGLATLHR